MGIRFTFVFLTLLLFFILVTTGYILSKQKKINSRNYWIISSIAILAYSLIEGLRYMRGTDYIHYKEWYTGFETRELEPAFSFLNDLLNFLGMPYPVAFVVYSFFTILGCFLLIKQYHKIALFAIPLFFLVTIVQSENLVRQMLAFSIILLSLKYLTVSDWLKFSVVIVVAFLMHYSSIILLPFIILFKFQSRPLIKTYILCIIYLLTFLWKPDFLESMTYLNLLQGGDLTFDSSNYGAYVNNAERWLTVADFYVEPSLLYKIRLCIFNLGVIILGNKLALKNRDNKDNSFYLYYSLFLVGVVFQNITVNIELLYRFDLYFYMFGFIVLAFICYDAFNESKNKITKYICILLLLNLLYDSLIGRLINIDNINQMLFIWDK